MAGSARASEPPVSRVDLSRPQAYPVAAAPSPPMITAALERRTSGRSRRMEPPTSRSTAAGSTRSAYERSEDSAAELAR